VVWFIKMQLELNLIFICFKLASLKLLHWLNLNCASIIGRVLYKLCVFYVYRNSKMTTTAGHSFYIGPIGSFYNQVNDTGSWSINTGLLYPDYQFFSVKCVWRLQICLSSNIVIKLTFNAKQHTENSKNSFIANKF
jgi:hypothetical protein